MEKDCRGTVPFGQAYTRMLGAVKRCGGDLEGEGCLMIGNQQRNIHSLKGNLYSFEYFGGFLKKSMLYYSDEVYRFL